MNRGWTAIGKGLAKTLIALLVVLIAFERPLDAAAYAAAQEVEAGNSSPVLKFIAAFDVIDDAFDHQTGSVPHERSQIVVQLALPEPALTNVAKVAAALVEHPQHFADALFSRASLPLDRPPRA